MRPGFLESGNYLRRESPARRQLLAGVDHLLHVGERGVDAVLAGLWELGDHRFCLRDVRLGIRPLLVLHGGLGLVDQIVDLLLDAFHHLGLGLAGVLGGVLGLIDALVHVTLRLVQRVGGLLASLLRGLVHVLVGLIFFLAADEDQTRRQYE